MKKLYLLIVLSLMTVACSSKEVDESFKEVHFPAYFYEGVSESEIQNEAKESGASEVEFIGDEKIIFKFTEKNFNKKFKDIEESLNDYLDDVVKNQDYPSIVGTNANSDYSQLSFIVDKSQFELNEDVNAIIGITISATYYQLFLNKENINVTSKIIDDKTGGTIETIILPDR